MTATLVLLPGLDGTGDLFAPLLDVLGESLPVIVVRYPPAEPLGYDELTDLAEELLPTDRSFVLLGESFSGPVAVKLAARSPRGLLGLILCVSFVASPRPRLAHLSGLLDVIPMRLLAEALGPPLLMGRYRTPGLRQLFVAAMGAVSPSVLRARLKAAARVDVSPELRAIAVPARYLRASEDALIPRSAAERFARQARNGSISVIDGPHSMLQCVPERAAGPIVRFVGECERG